eukprot:s55_g3.t1
MLIPQPGAAVGHRKTDDSFVARRILIAVGTAAGAARPELRVPNHSGHCQTSTASSGPQWALPDLNCECPIAVGTAGPQPPAPDRSGHCRTSTASSRSQGTAGPELRVPDRSGHCWTSAASSRSQWALPGLICQFQIAVGTAGPELRVPDRSGHCRTSTALPDLNRLIECQKECHAVAVASPSSSSSSALLFAVQISLGTPGPRLPAPNPSGHCRTSSASSRSHWALLDFICQLQSALGTAGLQRRLPDSSAGRQPRLPDRSGHCRTSAATARSQWAMPGFSGDRESAIGTTDCSRDCQISVGTAGLHGPAPDRSGHCRTSGRMSEYMSDRMPN